MQASGGLAASPSFPSLLVAACLGLGSAARAQPPASAFDILVIAERVVDGKPEIHAPFVEAGRVWLDKLAADSNLTVTYVESPNAITEASLAKYELIFQMNYTPYRWNAAAKAAFEKYIDGGRGGWVGLHHATLFGPVVTPQGEPLWTWFYDFLGKINFKNYIAGFAAGTVRVEVADHAAFKGVPANFTVAKDEWYTWDKSPRPNVKVLANVDENSYQPPSAIKMGDHPVVWTNEKYAARNLFIFMGHHPDHFQNGAYVALLRNSLFWAAGRNVPSAIARPSAEADVRVRRNGFYTPAFGPDRAGPVEARDAAGRRAREKIR